MEPGGGVAVLGVLDPVELGLVPRLGCVVEFAPLGGGMQPGGGDPVAVVGGVVDERLTGLAHDLADRVGVLDRRRLRLDRELEQLVVDPALQDPGRRVVVHEFLDPRRRVRVLVDDVELLLDAECTHPVEGSRRP